jgi:hypothetical protein
MLLCLKLKKRTYQCGGILTYRLRSEDFPRKRLTKTPVRKLTQMHPHQSNCDSYLESHLLCSLYFSTTGVNPRSEGIDPIELVSLLVRFEFCST